MNIGRWLDDDIFQVQFKSRNENEAITEHCRLENAKFSCAHESVQKQEIGTGWLGGHKPSDTIERVCERVCEIDKRGGGSMFVWIRGVSGTFPKWIP